MGSPKQVYRDRAPLHGYATDDVRSGLRMYAADTMLQKALAQHNAKHSLSWLVYDLDSESAFLDWQDVNAPPPNIVALNPDNGHAHLFYGLQVPVHNYATASHKALRYMAAVDIALTHALSADPGYSKLISKNPLHDRWIVLVPRADLYDLDELASWLDLKRYQDKRKRLPAEGYGRNCTLFETLRRWAYSERRKDQQYLSESMFQEAVTWRGLAINAEFVPPLPHSEVRSTCKSISRWTWARISREGFIAWQRKQSRAGNAAKQRKATERRERIVQTARECPELSQADIAAMCGVTQQTVSNHLRAYKYPISDKDSSPASSQIRRPPHE